MEQPSNRGRSTLHITEEVAQSHRLSRQRHDTNHVTGNVLREGSQAGPTAAEPPPQTSTVAAQAPSKKRGRPRVVVTEDVLEQRRLAKQRRNARRSKKNVLGEISHRDAASELPTTKNSATENVLGQSSRADATFELPTTNKSAPATGAPFKKRGRPRVAITNDGLDQRRLSSQMRNARSAEKNILRPASHADVSSEAHPPTNYTGGQQ